MRIICVADAWSLQDFQNPKQIDFRNNLWNEFYWPYCP